MLLDKLIKSIYSVNHGGKDHVPNSIEIKEILNKYSSSGLPTLKLIIDENLQLSRADKVSYMSNLSEQNYYVCWEISIKELTKLQKV